MITGFNTDIEYQGVTYHVQTEDKGTKTPLILSLVYNRGTILASKRSPYDDLLSGEFDENQLAERLQKQHKLICAAIRAGRIEELKKMTAKAAAEKRAVLKTEKNSERVVQETGPAIESQQTNEEPVVESNLKEDLTAKQNFPEPFDRKETGKSEFGEEVWEIPLNVLEDSVILDDVQIIEDVTIIPTEAIQIIEESPKDEAVDTGLKIEMLDNITFTSGERKALALIVKRNNSESGLDGAQVMVKITGTSFRPLIFHAKTDENGVAVVHLQLPNFRAGRAAVLIKAMSGGEETEIRRSIQHD